MNLNNPFPAQGHLDRCWLFSYRIPEKCIRPLLPAPLEPITRGEFAFWNIVVCRIQEIRPCGFPAWTGLDYWHVAYRLPARFSRRHQPAQEGLYFVRSDCDSASIVTLGNILSPFRFYSARIICREENQHIDITVDSAQAPARVILSPQTPSLADGSPFSSLKEADTFLKYKPFALSPGEGRRVRVVPVLRDEAHWKSRLLQVESAEWEFLRGQPAQLELCQELAPIDYVWGAGYTLEDTK